MTNNLEVFSDLSERLNYNISDLPVYVRKGEIQQFNDYSALAHWHSDIEFILILSGAMEYFINGQTISLKMGAGVFVNSHRLHYGFSEDHTNCSFIVVVINPALLGEGSSLMRAYWEDKFGPTMDDFVLLTDQYAWQQQIINSIQTIYKEMHNGQDVNPLRLASQALSLCASVGDHLSQNSAHPEDTHLWSIVQKMTGFIHQHYEQKITLNDIAFEGAICRSRCCSLFNKYIGQTPNTYITLYRIQKSCEMLKETKRSMNEIALACGFQSASYFSFVFRKHMGFAPQDYRSKI